jgi:hypothetical protein
MRAFTDEELRDFERRAGSGDRAALVADLRALASDKPAAFAELLELVLVPAAYRAIGATPPAKAPARRARGRAAR